MAGFNFGGLEQALADTQGSGVSFESQAKKWETEEEGLCEISYFCIEIFSEHEKIFLYLQQKILSKR